MIQPNAHSELMDALSELLAKHPELRLGQLLCNLTLAARGPDCSLWDIEDRELLAAANELLEQNASA